MNIWGAKEKCTLLQKQYWKNLPISIRILGAILLFLTAVERQIDKQLYRYKEIQIDSYLDRKLYRQIDI